MADPSARVAQPLRPHVHLLSGNRFPIVAQLSLEHAFRYLKEAPTIVKQAAPMYWQYVSAPTDGTTWLEWLAPDMVDNYPSDGYVWADTETQYRQDYGGYTIEMRMHRAGYRPGHEHMTQHSRTRYHFVAKNPALNAGPPDPSLWIVHYHASDPSHLMSVSSIPMMPHSVQIMNQRRWLESLGRLERKEFMLHDRENWPALHLPNQPNMQQGVYGANQMPGAQLPPNPYRPQQYVQQTPGPPNKRPRTQGPGAHPPPGVSDVAHHDTSIEDEENTSYGDYFDHLSQRDISIARYTQHHRWMEEIFSSAYATSQIVPVDLGLGLMGELKPLTEGILEPPSLELVEREDMRPTKPEEAKPFTDLKQDQLEEFSKRVEKHLEEGKAEIERMKADHAQKMRAWKTVNQLAQAEKKLRYATWAGHEDAVPAFRFEQVPANSRTDALKGTEKVEDLVADVEKLIGAKIKPFEDATLVAKGGLQERKSQNVSLPEEKQSEAGGIARDTLGSGSAQPHVTATTSNPQSTTQNQSLGHQQTAQGNGQTTARLPTFPQPAAPSHQITSQNTATLNGSGANGASGDAIDDIDIPDLDDIDMSMDIGEPDLQFDDAIPDIATPAGQEQRPTAAAAQNASNNNMNAETFGDDNTFDDLIGGNDDDGGLIDFEGGMDDSAFGDAIHGME